MKKTLENEKLNENVDDDDDEKEDEDDDEDYPPPPRFALVPPVSGGQ